MNIIEEKIKERPRFYYIDLHNYTDEFLIEIIIWQKKEIERLKDCTEVKA